MKFTKRIVVIGSSLGIIIDKKLLEKLKVKKKEWVEVDIKKVNGKK